MPKFLDVPQWYDSSGFLTSSVNSYSFLITVHYEDSSETNEVTAYIPISSSDDLSSLPFDTPLSYFIVLAISSQKTQYVPCWGVMRKGASANATHALLTYAEISTTGVVFHANYVSTNYPYKIMNATFTMGLSDSYTSTFISTCSNSGYLSK